MSSNKKSMTRETNEDRISNLPDSLIHHIFSFLDMKFVVPTSVLSSRWKHLWMSLPFLYFGNKKYQSNELMTFIDQVFVHRDKSDVKSFCVNGVKLKLSWLFSLLVTLTRRNVEEIDISNVDTCELTLPNCLFSCKSLRTLKLGMLDSERFQFDLKTRSISLPKLKVLSLGSVRFVDEVAINNLLSSCLELEALTIHECKFLALQYLTISAPKLKHLIIEDFPEYKGKFPNGYNCKIEICAPNLTSFKFIDHMNTKYQLVSCPALNSAEIQIFPMDTGHKTETIAEHYADLKEKIAEMEVNVLKAICNVKVLTLSASFLEFLSGSLAAAESFPSEFRNLKHLKLTSLSRDSISTVMIILQISPNIETLKLELTKTHRSKDHTYRNLDEGFDEENAGDHSESILSRQRKLQHLKVFEMRGVIGCENELKFVKALLKDAVVLEEMFIFTSKRNSSEADREIGKKLSKFHRASANATILIHHL